MKLWVSQPWLPRNQSVISFAPWRVVEHEQVPEIRANFRITLASHLIAEKFRSNVQRNAQILPEGLRQLRCRDDSRFSAMLR
jgi:hypothetical protein